MFGATLGRKEPAELREHPLGPPSRVCSCSWGLLQHQDVACELFRLFLLILRVYPCLLLLHELQSAGLGGIRRSCLTPSPGLSLPGSASCSSQAVPRVLPLSTHSQPLPAGLSRGAAPQLRSSNGSFVTDKAAITPPKQHRTYKRCECLFSAATSARHGLPRARAGHSLGHGHTSRTQTLRKRE